MEYEYPEGKAYKQAEIEGLPCSFLQHDMGHKCGYARFPAEFPIDDYNVGVMKFVPVHGGITYAKRDKDGTVIFGFDAAHDNSPPHEEQTDEWLTKQCRVMIQGVRMAPTLNPEFAKAETPEERGKVADKVCGLARDQQMNFGSMIWLMAGGPADSED